MGANPAQYQRVDPNPPNPYPNPNPLFSDLVYHDAVKQCELSLALAFILLKF